MQVHGVAFKKRAPRAIKEIRGFAIKAMVRGPSLYLFNPSDSTILLLTCMSNAREPRMSALTLNSTRKSGRRVSKACHTDYA